MGGGRNPRVPPCGWQYRALFGTIASGYATRNQRANLQTQKIQVELAVRGALQGYLAHKKTQPPRTLPQAYV